MSREVSIRLQNLDFIKFIAIFFVVWGHALQYGLGEIRTGILHHPASEWIVSFHMPLFMMISGFFAFKTLDKNIFIVLKQKISKLFIPALAWTLINVSIIALRGKNPFLYSSWFGWMFSNYWYITCLVLCILIFYISMKAFKNDVLACGISILLCLILPYCTNWFLSSMLPFFWAGHFVRKYKNDFAFGWIAIVFCLLSWIILFRFWSIKDYSIYYAPATLFKFSPFHLTKYNFLASFFRTAIGIVASISIIGILNKIYFSIRKMKIMNLFVFIGRETLPVYLIHVIAIVALANIFTLPNDTDLYLYDFLLVHIYTLWGLAVSVSLTYIGIRIPIVRNIFFGK